MDTPKLYRSILHLNPAKDPRRDRPQRDWIANPYRVHQRIMWALDGALPERNEHGQRAERDDKSPLPLFRIFPESGRVLVQTATEPNWKRAFTDDHHEAPFLLDPKRDPDAREYAPELVEGADYLFQLLANPVRREHVPPPAGGWKAAKARAKEAGTKWKSQYGKRKDILKPKDFEEAKGVPESQRAQWLAEHREQRQLEWIVAHLQHDSGFEPVPMGTPGKRDPHGQEMVAGVGICVRETFTVRAFKGHKSDDRPPEHKKPIELHAVIFEGVLRVTNPARALKTIQHGIGPAKGLGFGLLLLGRRLAIREGESANR